MNRTDLHNEERVLDIEDVVIALDVLHPNRASKLYLGSFAGIQPVIRFVPVVIQPDIDRTHIHIGRKRLGGFTRLVSTPLASKNCSAIAQTIFRTGWPITGIEAPAAHLPAKGRVLLEQVEREIDPERRIENIGLLVPDIEARDFTCSCCQLGKMVSPLLSAFFRFRFTSAVICNLPVWLPVWQEPDQEIGLAAAPGSQVQIQHRPRSEHGNVIGL